MIGVPGLFHYIEAPLLIMSSGFAAQLAAIAHLADMARGNVSPLEPHLCTTQSVGMPDTCGLSLSLQSKLHYLSATVS